MSKKFKISIKCSQVVHYDQQVEVTEEQLALLQGASKLGVSGAGYPATYSLIEDLITHSDIVATDREYNDLQIVVVREVIPSVFPKKTFLSGEFYEVPTQLINVFQELFNIPECHDEFEMYTEGGFLSWTVKVDQCEDYLSTMIIDLNAYRIMSDEHYGPESDPNILNLSLLHAEHTEFFANEYEIYWDRDKDFFTFKGEYNAYNFGL